MKEYLVESHLGGIYVTTGNPDKIEEFCEQCGDYDVIGASWEQEDEEEQFKEILSYCYKAYDLSDSDILEEDFKEWLNSSGYEQWSYELEEDIRDLFGRILEIIDLLETDNVISQNVAKKLRVEIVVNESNWLSIARSFDYSKISDSVTVLRK